jgi:hypothetical protein
VSDTRARKKVSLPRFGAGSDEGEAARFAQPLAPLTPLTPLPRPTSAPEHAVRAAAPWALPKRPDLAAAAPEHDLAALQANKPRSIAISTRLMALVDDVAAGVLLGQLVFWSRHGIEVVERGGWVFKTAHDWELETSLSWKAQRRAREILLRAGLIEERRLSMPARLEYRLRLATIFAALGPSLGIAPDTATNDWRAWQSPMPDGTPGVAEQLLGRSFLFHAALGEPLTLTGAMMCSRLLAGVRWNGRGPVIPAASGGPAYTRFVGMPRSRWRLETGLSREQWQTARRRLLEAGLLAERFANYPRRVDLAIDLTALSELLKSSGAGQGRPPPAHASRGIAPEGRRDRAKQASDVPVSPNPAFMDRPIPLTGSPDPAFRNRPILPSVIARSRLYLSESQAMTPQPPPPLESARGEPVAAGATASGRGGGGGGGGDSATQGELHWPGSFTAGDREQAGRHLAALPRDVQQSVLDEVQWAHQNGSVRSPVGLTRSLVAKAQAGTFAPDGAHRVAEARAGREAHERLLASRTPTQPMPQPELPRERTAEEEARYQANRARLMQVTEALKRRAG